MENFPSPETRGGAAALIYHVGSICSLVKYHPREQTQGGHLTFLDERWLLCSPPGTKQIRGRDVCQRTFQRGHQMGAWVMTPGPRTPSRGIGGCKLINLILLYRWAEKSQYLQVQSLETKSAWQVPRTHGRRLSLVSLLCPLQ